MDVGVSDGGGRSPRLATLTTSSRPDRNEPSRPVPGAFLAHAGHALAELVREGSPTLRADAHAGHALALRKVIGLTVAEALEVLSEEAGHN